MSPPLQKAVFSAEKLLSRTNGHIAVAISGANGNGHAHDASDLDALRAAIEKLTEKVDSLAQGGTLAAPNGTAPSLPGIGANVDQATLDKVRNEVEQIAARITLTKQEIASLKHPLAKEDKLTSASCELSAVVKATEEATTAIMQTAEHLDEIVREITTQVTDAYVISRLNEMSEHITKLFEACSFQDLTGQRITKVVKTLDYIEERVETMQVIWGRKDIEKIPVPENDLVRKDDGLSLHGPSDAAQGAISQDDIDKLFN
jgi:chemotaxis protein CheZ